MNIPIITPSRGIADWLYLGLRLALALVFVYAGAVKLMDPKAFALVVSRYGLAPDFLLAPVALGLPALEVLAGLGLILDLRGSLSAITAMLLMFAAVLWFGVLQGLSIDCGCFSAEEQAGHDGLRAALGRDLALLAVAAYLYLHRWRTRAARPAGGWRLVHPMLAKKEEIAR
ncbi:MAG: MauE/DoxX family redox-associated membrane protein [Thermodesulfobacteriota bacterium]